MWLTLCFQEGSHSFLSFAWMPIHIGMLGTLYFYASGLEGGVEKILFRGGQIFQKFNKKVLLTFLKLQKSICITHKVQWPQKGMSSK